MYLEVISLLTTLLISSCFYIESVGTTYSTYSAAKPKSCFTKKFIINFEYSQSYVFSKKNTIVLYHCYTMCTFLKS